MYKNDKLMNRLWTEFYIPAILSGLRFSCLRLSLVEWRNSYEAKNPVMKEFINELEMIWINSHPDDKKECTGFTCEHLM